MSARTFTRVASVFGLCIPISILLSLYWDNTRWLSIAVVAAASILLTFCTFVVSMTRQAMLEGVLEAKRPRAFMAFFLVVNGIVIGLLLLGSFLIAFHSMFEG